MTIRTNRTIRSILLAAAAFFAAGCATDPNQGYAPTSVFPTSIATVAVPIFTNETYSRDVEFELTDAVIKEIETRTPYKVTGEGRADSILLGRVRAVEIDRLSKSATTGLSEEAVLTVTIDVEWRDLRSGARLLERKGFAGNGLFVPSTPSSEPIELGEFAAVQQLARALVDEMQSGW